MAPAGTIAPTEISSTPQSIKRPTGIAMMPRFAATLSQLESPAISKKDIPPKLPKKINTARRPRNAPASGRRNRAADEKLIFMEFSTELQIGRNSGGKGESARAVEV